MAMSKLPPGICFRWVLGIAVALTGSVSWAQRDLQNIPDPDPELERQTFVVPEGFEVSLYAADPLLAKPIQMNFDDRGRLWIASSSVYPQIKPGQVADDKILVIEDQDHNGVAETTTVFAGGLLIPTGVLPSSDGAYVANSTDLLFMRDLDGDGRADQREVVLSGFGTEDTHHILHTLRWGPDAYLYMNQSIYIHSHIETPWGVRRMNGSGTWTLRPKSLELSIFSLGLVNPWGTAWDEFGRTFATDGAGGEGINYIFPGFVGVTSPGAKRILSGLNPGKPKLCGLEMVGGSHLPDDWQGNLITNDFRAHRVCRYEVREEGSGFTARELDELIKSSHVAFRPIDVKQGPDGAIYIADWYNPIIQHGEVDFRDPRRDLVHGRIWRVKYRGRDLVQPVDIPAQTTAQLIELLKSRESWQRQQAKQTLVHRGPSVVEPLLNWVEAIPADAPQGSEWRLHALWTLVALDHWDIKLVDQLQADADHRVRAAVMRIIGDHVSKVPQALTRLAAGVRDIHPQVRLEAVRGLARSTDPQACLLALQALDQPMDRFLEFGLWRTVNDLQDLWLPALQRGELQFGDRTDHLTYALQAVERADMVPMLTAALADPGLSVAGQRALLITLARVAANDQLGLVWERLSAGSTSEAERLRILEELLKRREVGEVHWENWPQLLSATDPALRRAALDAVGQWGGKPLLDTVRQLARDAEQDPALRARALAALGRLGEAADQKWLLELADSNEKAELRSAAVTSLAQQNISEAAQAAVRWMADERIQADPQPMITGLLERPGGVAALTQALAQQQIRQDAARLALRGLESTGRKEVELAAALTTAGRVDQPRKAWTAEQRQAFLQQVASEGDPRHGEELFRRAQLNCFKCHAIGGAGGEVGPDLASIGASAQPDYLLDSLLDPNSKIKENYHSLVVVTDDGRIQSGIKLRETENTLILRDAENQVREIPLSSIEDKQDGGSLMPTGLTDNLTDVELRDLMRFLSELGKSGAYALPTQTYWRRWETLNAELPNVDLAAQQGVEQVIEHPEQFTWATHYARVNGEVGLADLVAVKEPSGGAAWSVLQGVITVGEATPLRLALNDNTGLQAWLDGVPIELEALTTNPLSPGEHRLQLVIDRSARSAELTVQVQE